MPNTPTPEPKLDPQAWIGRQQVLHARIDAVPVQALAATLGLDCVPGLREPLPAGWHWLFFNPAARRQDLGEDGHPRRTPDSFLPPVELPRRMWAGSRIQYLSPLKVGSEAVRISRILRVTPKAGRSGPICFVTVAHAIESDGRTCILEEQDIVYRESSEPRPVVPVVASGDPAPVAGAWTAVVRPDPVLLFRYSALTFNGHRIHYDQAYAQGTEGYEGLVVHGPLTATLLQGFAASLRPDRRLAAFDFKGVAPLFAHQAFTLCADEGDSGSLSLRAITSSGHAAMEARAEFVGGT